MKKISKDKNEGFVLTAVLMLLLIGSLVAGAFVVSSRQTLRAVEKWREYDECLLAAQTAMEKVKSNLYTNFDSYNSFTFTWTNIYWLTINAKKFSTNGTLASIAGADSLYPSATIVATITPSTNITGTFESQVLYITNRVTATWKGKTRTTEEITRYVLTKSEVFDHAYFINNFGWFDGVDMVVNGDIRSNFDIQLNSASLVLNGNSMAGWTNKVLKTPLSWTWTAYKADTNHAYSRPGYNVDLVKGSANVWSNGYNANSVTRSNKVDQMEMPYIGNLDDYRFYAQEKGGTISTGKIVVVGGTSTWVGAVIVDATFRGLGPSAYTNAADRMGFTGYTNGVDKGTLVLIGTTNNPIKINGPVVVDQDVILKGYYTGQGTIYAGRNIHIIGDLTAISPAQWAHPETSLSTFTNVTLANNLKKDFLGLCAKGAIVLGDYMDSGFLSGIAAYLKPNFTSRYPVTATDADIGYVSYYENGTNFFDGDYTKDYGSKCGSKETNSEGRAYYEATISTNKLKSLSPTNVIMRIDATLYDNHLIAGKVGVTGKNAIINGGLICRDEALLLAGRTYLNWDPRIAMDSQFKPYLPMGLKPAKTILWRELKSP